MTSTTSSKSSSTTDGLLPPSSSHFCPFWKTTSGRILFHQMIDKKVATRNGIIKIIIIAVNSIYITYTESYIFYITYFLRLQSGAWKFQVVISAFQLTAAFPGLCIQLLLKLKIWSSWDTYLIHIHVFLVQTQAAKGLSLLKYTMISLFANKWNLTD